MMHLFFQRAYTHVLFVGYFLLGFQVLDYEFEDVDVLTLLCKLLFTFLKRVFHDADLFIQQGEFVIPPDQVCA